MKHYLARIKPFTFSRYVTEKVPTIENPPFQTKGNFTFCSMLNNVACSGRKVALFIPINPYMTLTHECPVLDHLLNAVLKGTHFKEILYTETGSL